MAPAPLFLLLLELLLLPAQDAANSLSLVNSSTASLPSSPVPPHTSSLTTTDPSTPTTTDPSTVTTTDPSSPTTNPSTLTTNGTSSPTTNGTSSPTTNGTSSPTTSPSTLTTNGTSSPTTNGTSSPTTNGTSSPTTNGTLSPSTTGTSSPTSSPASHSARTATSTTNHSVETATSSDHKTSPQVSIRISFFFLSFSISNLQFNSCLEDPNTSYYQQLQRNISEWFLQSYKQEDFLGLSNIKFRPGSVVVEAILAFRQGTTSALDVKAQLEEHKAEAAEKYGLSISSVRARDSSDASIPPVVQSGPGVPGWGIAVLVLVCVLLALAVVYFLVLTMCQCRRKNCGQLDLFATRDAYHPMSEYPTYHTHGRYVPPGSTRRSPYEEVSPGNGGGSLAYTNPAATSADL
ncbi:mucin-1 isoform X2 [Crocuta crocuta]